MVGFPPDFVGSIFGRGPRFGMALTVTHVTVIRRGE
jgi:hypothetical protein